MAEVTKKALNFIKLSMRRSDDFLKFLIKEAKPKRITIDKDGKITLWYV